MIIFSFPEYQSIAEGLLRNPGNQAGEFEVKPFSNGELHCKVATKVTKQKCVIVSSFAAGGELQCLLLSHTLKFLGAGKIILLAPYLGYMRQDKKETGRSLGSAWVGGLFKSSGIASVVTVEVHSDMAKKFLALPVVSLGGAPLFAGVIESFLDSDITIMAPDKGAFPKAKALRAATSRKLPVSHFNKVRTEKGVILTPPKGKISQRVVIVDDVLDTGGTLVGACKILKAQGVKDIVICVTHGQFVGEKWKELWNLGVSRIYTSDSLPNRPKEKRIQTVPLWPLFQNQKL